MKVGVECNFLNVTKEHPCKLIELEGVNTNYNFPYFLLGSSMW